MRDEDYQRVLEEEFPSSRQGMLLTYLDHAGSTLPSKKQLDATFQELSSPQSPFSTTSNPHSTNSALSSLIEERIMETRQRVLRHFGVSGREGEHGDEQQEHDEYFVIFTSGATGAIKLVCDMFPWQTSTGVASTLCYTENIHTSVLGMREFAPKAYMLPSSNFLLQQQQTQAGSDNKSSSTSHYCKPTRGGIDNRDKCLPLNLFAYPGESNFDGSKMDMYAVGSWLRSMEREDSTLLDPQHRAVLTKKNSCEYTGKSRWLSLLDASKLASTSSIDLSSLPSHIRPDFVCCSFYKMFGYPTGIGALLMKKELIPFMKKRFYGGGTIAAAAVETMLLRPEQSVEHPHVPFEDGTLNFHGILALKHGFDALDRFGMKAIEKYTSSLTEYALQNMRELKHSNGGSLCQVYSSGSSSASKIVIRGSIVAFNLLAYDGAVIGFNLVGDKCAEAKFQVRTGCFCNIGSCQRYFHMSASDVLHNLEHGRHCHSTMTDLVDGKPTGAIRISIGYMTKKKEIDSFLSFLHRKFCDFGETSVSNEVIADKRTARVDYLGDNSDHILEDYVIRNICIYPIKSCGGQEVDDWPLGSDGLLFDRTWVLVDHFGQVMTQKKYPQMVKIIPRIDLASEKISFQTNYNKNVDEIEGVDSITVSIRSIMEEIDGDVDGERHEENQLVRVCGRRRVVRNCDKNEEARGVNAWFSHILGVECRLVTSRCSERKKENAVSNDSFKNDQPFLVITKESICKLSQLTGEKISHMVFRPSLVVERTYTETSKPNSEFIYNWKAMVISQQGGNIGDGDMGSQRKIRLRSQGPCQRCSMLNVDPSSGENDGHVLQALMNQRSELQATTANKVYFGEFFTYDKDDVPSTQVKIPVTDDVNKPVLSSLRINDNCLIFR